MMTADDRLWVGVAGLVVFLLGFELAFVVSLSLVSEAMPEARGTTIALSNGVGTVARGTGTIASGLLFDWYGIAGSLTLSGGAVTTAAVAFTLNRHRRA